MFGNRLHDDLTNIDHMKSKIQIMHRNKHFLPKKNGLHIRFGHFKLLCKRSNDLKTALTKIGQHSFCEQIQEEEKKKSTDWEETIDRLNVFPRLP